MSVKEHPKKILLRKTRSWLFQVRLITACLSVSVALGKWPLKSYCIGQYRSRPKVRVIILIIRGES